MLEPMSVDGLKGGAFLHSRYRKSDGQRELITRDQSHQRLPSRPENGVHVKGAIPKRTGGSFR
jgi:hypothetical protein